MPPQAIDENVGQVQRTSVPPGIADEHRSA
jgi:hypothetical protein